MLKCPFCNSDAVLFSYPNTKEIIAICNNQKCECNARIFCETEEEAINKWNTRKYEKQISELGLYLLRKYWPMGTEDQYKISLQDAFTKIKIKENI